MARYVIEGPWTVCGWGANARVWFATLRDSKTGALYPQGAYKVKVRDERAKTFKGETAQSDSERFLWDAYWRTDRWTK